MRPVILPFWQTCMLLHAAAVPCMLLARLLIHLTSCVDQGLRRLPADAGACLCS